MGKMAGKSIFLRDTREKLTESFKILKRKIALDVFTKKGVNDKFNDLAIQISKELAELTDKIETRLHDIGGKASEQYKVSRSPTILIDPENYQISYTGAPAGEEMRSFIQSIIMASTDNSSLSKSSKERLTALKEKRHIQVFVTPTCPYCPQQALYAIAAAIEKKDMISAEVVETFENQDLAQKYNVASVPQTMIDGKVTGIGLQSEDKFISELLGFPPEEVAIKKEAKEITEVDVVIIGAGPAGLTAAIYAERGGLKSVVLEKANIGGQVAITPIVENYPGFTRIPGKALMEMIAQHAMKYTSIRQGEEVLEIKLHHPFEVITAKGKYLTKAVILATGAVHRRLDVPGEQRLFGRGVSYCTTCDGYFYKGKKVIMVGGGNSAVAEALHLDSLGVQVTLVHRRDSLRAEARLQESLFNRKIPVLWNSRVKEIMGEKVVTTVKIENIKEETTKEYPVDGVFVSIGYEPSNLLAKKLDIELDENGYIKVDRHQRANIPGIYAAGDITGGVKQIVTAVGEGATAALATFEDISSPYWKT